MMWVNEVEDAMERELTDTTNTLTKKSEELWKTFLDTFDCNCVTPQPVLSCNVRDVGLSWAKSYQDFSSGMNKIVGAELNQI